MLAIDDRISHGAGKRRMGDTDGGKSEAARWSRLLRWLDDKQGMDTSQLAVEARSVEGKLYRVPSSPEVYSRLE